ncbi:DUF4132 domain-containing protein [Plantactinospora sp. S1510]|uniref:DUF4132 domain-containing protein n=1 Tax=Plantactinospora alkalitolerans TaxID=2789879 RepID=A0ABS0H2Q5_9ACTN|nr:DUF4132 domain-containing protein [Plantactinospora alkalitolerans]MBF9132429.1 DUF4132 domain-containing protein [Plantactinospora alkalitolerans]
MGWLSAGDSYEISLVDGKVVARSAARRGTGRPLKTLPKALRDHPEVDRLRQLAEWLDRHSADCVARVETWMVSSLPVPTGLLARVWPDPAWQGVLRDLVVMGDDLEQLGLLRDVTDSGELRVVDLDGETLRMSPQTVTLPHPVLLPELEDLREFVAELGVSQRVEQLHRATWPKPSDLDGTATRVSDFREARLASRAAVTARASALGYQASSATVSCRIYEAGRIVEASVWINGEYWENQLTMGDLSWLLGDGRPLPLSEVGPVAWSEGIRMAATLSGGRPVGVGKGV